MRTRFFSATLALALGPMGLLLAPGALAADPGAAASALKVLTESLPAASAAPTAARESLVVQRSETLDVLIHRRFSGWPFKDEVFRRALADLNPTVLPNASNNLLKRGSTLVLPSAEDLRQTLQKHYPASGELLRVRVELENDETPTASRSATQRRWVRFP